MKRSYFKSVETLKNYLLQRRIVHALLLEDIPLEYKLSDNKLLVRSKTYKKWEPSSYSLEYLFKLRLYK